MLYDLVDVKYRPPQKSAPVSLPIFFRVSFNPCTTKAHHFELAQPLTSTRDSHGVAISQNAKSKPYSYPAKTFLVQL